MLIFLAPSEVELINIIPYQKNLTATWKEPEKPNGILRYNINFCQKDCPPSEPCKNFDFNETSYVFNNLSSYIQYEVSVTPFTEGGRGNNISKTVRTLKGRELHWFFC